MVVMDCRKSQLQLNKNKAFLSNFTHSIQYTSVHVLHLKLLYRSISSTVSSIRNQNNPNDQIIKLHFNFNSLQIQIFINHFTNRRLYNNKPKLFSLTNFFKSAVDMSPLETFQIFPNYIQSPYYICLVWKLNQIEFFLYMKIVHATRRQHVL